MSNGLGNMKLHTEQFFRCLADPLRLNITMLLMHEGELCACEIADSLEEKLSSASRHLVLLRNKGLVKERRDELWLYYTINDEIPDWAKQLLDIVYQGNLQRLEEPLALLRGNNEHTLCMHT